MANDFNQHPIVNSNKTSIKRELPIESVDELANELVFEYANPSFRRWYCGVIYEFGFSKVIEWRRRASEGKIPAKLFSKYVKESRTFKSAGKPRI